jgi:hypothetical protein
MIFKLKGHEVDFYGATISLPVLRLRRKRKLTIQWEDFFNPEVEEFKPKLNQRRRVGLMIFLGVCIATPFSNWAIPVVLKTIKFYSPLFMYQ